jgi:putative endonuclease
VREHEYFVYIMSSNSGTLYIGVTNSIYRRTLQHEKGEIEGFSSRYHCNRLAHYESYDDVHRAIGCEKQLKGWTRARKIAFDRVQKPKMGGFGRTLGSTNVVCWAADEKGLYSLLNDTSRVARLHWCKLTAQRSHLAAHRSDATRQIHLQSNVLVSQ